MIKKNFATIMALTAGLPGAMNMLPDLSPRQPKQKTESDYAAIAKAEAKRERKAAMNRGKPTILTDEETFELVAFYNEFLEDKFKMTMATTTLENGKTYLVNSQRKGTFMGRLIKSDETWANFLIVGGKARAILDYNEREKGEEVTVRKSFCSFTEQPNT